MIFGGAGRARPEQTQPRATAVAKLRQDVLIMVVDDGATSRAAIVGELEEAGYRVQAVDTYAAWDLAWRRGPRPDLLVLDIMLAEPKRGGYEILRSFRREDTRTPVIMVSARNTPADEAFARANHANAFVSKARGAFDHPVHGLVATVTRLLSS